MAKDWSRLGELPWGWWLRASSDGLEDLDGRRWRSVRDAFFQGELNFPAARFAPEQEELMLRTLVALDPQRSREAEHRHDLFDGNLMFWRHYHSWLSSIGMLSASDSLGRPIDWPEGQLSSAGRSVMMMLMATREPAWEELPMAEVIDAVASSMRGAADDAREQALLSFERQIGLRRHVFARECVGRSHLITLTSLAGGAGARMPVRRKTWSIAFTDAVARDDLFAWLASRVDRWDAWGEVAYHKGADAFGQHLLGLIVTSLIPGSKS